MKLRVEAGTLGTLSCRMITIEDRGEPRHWDHEVEEALEELEDRQPAGGDAGAVVIRGPGMMQIPECWSRTACRLSQVAGHLGIFIGLEQGTGAGTAVCIHPGDTAAALGDTFPYARPKPDTPAGRKEADWDKELRRRADRIWEGLNPRNGWRNEHQVLVCKRKSTIDRVLELVGDNIEKGTEAGIPLRAVLVDGPTGGWKGMRGFWLAVLNALGNRTERGNEHFLALQKEAVDTEREHWTGKPQEGWTILVVNGYDEWCRQIVGEHEDWWLFRELEQGRSFIVLGCAETWPPPCEQRDVISRMRVHLLAG